MHVRTHTHKQKLNTRTHEIEIKHTLTCYSVMNSKTHGNASPASMASGDVDMQYGKRKKDSTHAEIEHPHARN